MKFLTTKLDKNLSWLRHGFFMRTGGISSGPYATLNCGLKTEDDLKNITANRARVAHAIEIEASHLVIAKQVHGNHAMKVDKPWGSNATPEADAIVTATPKLALGVLTADCAPVFFVEKKKKIIGAAHAGWRGALGGILDSTVSAMQEMGGDLAEMEAAIGPCIGPRSYEVQADFKDAFLKETAANDKFFTASPKAGRFLFDLPGYVTERLKGLGVKTVHDIQQDTLAGEAAFFSNRRAFLKGEKGFGLQISVIAIQD